MIDTLHVLGNNVDASGPGGNWCPFFRLLPATVHTLELLDNVLGENDMECLGREMKCLRALKLSKNELTVESLEYLDKQYFGSWATLEQLVIDNNPSVGVEGAESLAQSLSCFPNLRLIQLRRADITDTGASKIARRLPRQPDGYRALVIDDAITGIKFKCKKVCPHVQFSHPLTRCLVHALFPTLTLAVVDGPLRGSSDN